MTLSEIAGILEANIAANSGTLRLTADIIPSPEITGLFSTYLLNGVLVITGATVRETSEEVAVSGQGDSFIFYSTSVDSLRFTVTAGVPSMTVTAHALISDTDGWTFGRSFPVLARSNWSGFRNPGNPQQWVQYIFFSEAQFSLTPLGLSFTGSLRLTGMLDALSTLFNTSEAEMSGSITINTGAYGYTVTETTAVPEMRLLGNIGVIDLSLGSFPVFTLDFTMNASAYILTTEGGEKGRPLPVTELLIETTMPMGNETIGIATVVGIQSGALTMQAIMPEHTEVGIPELISLANNENLLALMPSNIPVIYDFVLQDWSLSFSTKDKTLTQVAIQTATREAYSWVIIPGYITLKSVELWFGMLYLNRTFSPSLTIEGIITLGEGPNAVNFILSASFPSFVFMGSLDPDTPVNLRAILVYLLGEAIGNSLPDTLELGVLSIAVDPKNSTYSLDTALTTDLEIPVILTTIIVRTVNFGIKYVAGVATGNISGEFQVGASPTAPLMYVSAAYDGPEAGWVFSGGLSDGSRINLKDLIDTYLPPEYHGFNPFDISITAMEATFSSGPVTEGNSYSFKLGAEWRLDLGLTDPLVISALTEIAYARPVVVTQSAYTGYIQGGLDLGNIHIRARVDFKERYNDYTFIFLDRFEARLTHNIDGDSIICFQFTDQTSLGSIITFLVTAATGQDISLPSPWNVLNNIKLRDFGFSFNLTRNKIGISYRPSINLGFIDIKEITLYYTYYPNEPSRPPLVELSITDGSFLGGAAPLPQPWNVLHPEQAPVVPGQGETLFRLEFLGLGQHVALKDNLKPASVAQAVDMLKASFSTHTQSPTNPIKDTGLRFESSSNWLIGTQFLLVETFAIGIVFFDPDLYGLSLYVNGPRAQVFQGLKFEIMYKKVSDTVGVYQAYLKLPDAIRQLNFGAVSVTLPSLKIYIYTNGDFKVDFGFPANDNFSESFGLQMLPFIGSGGFYFGLLSAETAEKLPAATNGSFSPVISFGIGLRVGIGKEINKGLLKAGLSIVVQGSLEGTYAQFNLYNSQSGDANYYYIVGKLSLVGHIYGSVDFAIISAELDLKVYISTRIVFESYEPILISFTAGVSVSLRVRVNLGIFSFSINLSFSTRITEAFTIGSRKPKPWVSSSAYAAEFRRLPLRALDETSDCPHIPSMNWQPIAPEIKVALEVLYIPQFTVATDVPGEQKARAVAMLYLESPIDQPAGDYTGDISDGYPFARFARGAFLWVLGAYFNKTGEPIPVETVLEQEITIPALREIQCYFSQETLTTPFTLDQVFAFLAGYFNATVSIPPRAVPGSPDKSVSVLPILPNLIFSTPDGDHYFNDDQATYAYDEQQLALIHAYFRQLSVHNKGEQETVPAGSISDTEDKQSLATFLLIDYMSLLAKESVQSGIDRLTALVVETEENESLEDLVRRRPGLGISALELGHANRTRILRAGVTLAVGPVSYTIRHGDTLDKISLRFGADPMEVLTANSFVRSSVNNPCTPRPTLQETTHYTGFEAGDRVVPGAHIVIPGVRHTVAAKGESLLSVANRYGISVTDLVASNRSVHGLFPDGQKLVVPHAERITVSELLAAMEANFDFEQLSGLSANIMLQGLRVPVPVENSGIGEPAALYEVSGQQIDASGLSAGQELILKLPESLEWLHLGTEGGTDLPFVMEPEDIAALGLLQRTHLEPVLLELKAAELYEVQARKFTLPSYISWQLPVTRTLAAAHNEMFSDLDPGIWTFPGGLTALLTGYDAIAPRVRLMKQVQENVVSAAAPEPVTDYCWSTSISLRLQQIKSSEDPAVLMPNVYELQGIDQAAMTLLEQLIVYYAEHPGTDIIDMIDILYTKDPAKEGQTAPPNGLRSDSIDHTLIYLLQTNLSTLSNPPQLNAAARSAATPGTQPNLLGMTQLEFIKYIWEAAIVNSGGYYLYYQVSDSGEGLPEYLFNGDSDNVVTLVISYRISDDILQGFINSAVIKDPIDIQDEILYIETLPQQLNEVTAGLQETLRGLADRYRASATGIAQSNQEHRLRPGVNLQIPAAGPGAKGSTYTTAGQETLAAIAAAYGVSLAALAQANSDTQGMFDGPLNFDSRVEVKVATVPPGNIGFTVKRLRPTDITGLDNGAVNLQELYNLLGYHIAANDDFNASVQGLPVAPGDNRTDPPGDPVIAVRPTAEAGDSLTYNRIVPVYPFVREEQEYTAGDEAPPADKNPYRAVGKTARIDLRWQDIFGNLTGFTNQGGPGVPTALPPIRSGYIDPVIGISLYPSTSASYIIDKSVSDTPELRITLAFNPTNYLPVDAEDMSWTERSLSDLEAYTTIYYQLVQADVSVTLSCSLQGAEGYIDTGGTAKQALLDIVLSIYRYLGLILADPAGAYVYYTVSEEDTLQSIADQYGTTPVNIRRANPSIPADGQITEGEHLVIPLHQLPADVLVSYPVADSNPQPLFPLMTSWTVSRSQDLVDDHFKDEPSVIFSTSVLGPNLGGDGEHTNSGSITIQDFAGRLQHAFPALKAASGISQKGVADNMPTEIWVVRFDESGTGIRFSITDTGDPAYFALLPLANHLMSRDRVKIYPYQTGQPVYDSTPVESSFSGIDMETLAEDCLQAIDVFLQADYAIPAWQVEHNTEPPQSGSGGPEILQPYQHIIEAKKTLADAISRRIATVLDQEQPDEYSFEQARERIKQELLISLSNAYAIDTVLQFGIEVQSPYTDTASVAPNLFGKVAGPDDTVEADRQAYAFSTTRFSLENSASFGGGGSPLTILFNTRKGDDLHLESGYFPIDLRYEINSIEHNIHSVESIEGYRASSWLTFILPFDAGDTQLGALRIPVPLRAYPTAPSLTAQTFVSGVPGDAQPPADPLQEAKTWDYLYSYDYLRAQQDTIYADLLVNVGPTAARLAAFDDEQDPDLLTALLQFSSAYRGIQDDLNRYLLDQSDPAKAFTAMQSMAWLTGRVATAWGYWEEDQELYKDQAASENTPSRYQFTEGQTEIEGQDALRITVTPQGTGGFALPEITIEGFITETLEDRPELRSFAYYTLQNETRHYLSPDEGRNITQRNILYKHFNIIEQENVWSGLSVARNKILVPGIATSEAFIYTTPVIRFVSVLTPLLDSDTPINLAQYTAGSGRRPLQVYLSNFLKALFAEIADQHTVRQIKLGAVYRYNIQAGIDGLSTDIPISISTPYNFRIPEDWDSLSCPEALAGISPQSPFVCQWAAVITQWFRSNNPITTDARIKLDVSLYSGLSDTHLPVLRLNDLYIMESEIKWD